MKTLLKFILPLLLATLTSETAFCQPFFRQFFDGNPTSNTLTVTIEPNSLWQIGAPQKLLFNRASSLPNVIVTDTLKAYTPNSTSRFTISVKPEAQNGIYAVRWLQKLDMDPGKDGGIVEYSIDTGKTWTNIFNNPYVYNLYGFDPENVDTLPGGQVGFSGQDTTWKDIWLCFDMSWVQQVGRDSILIRYSMISDSFHSGREGWMIDNMTAHLTIQHTISETEQTSYLNIYPTPSTDILHIEAKKLQEFHIIEEIVLTNSAGQVVDKWYNLPTKFWISTMKYANGNYFLRVKTNIQTQTTPIIIQHE